MSVLHSVPQPAQQRCTEPVRPYRRFAVIPLEKYHADLAREDFVFDAAQESVLEQLQNCFDALTEPPLLTRQVLPWWKMSGREPEPTAPPLTRGLYIWGRVGRGKTYLMDSFFHCLPAGVAERWHFHRFMQMVHQGLRVYAGHKNPLQAVAGSFAKRARVLCLDEFYVEDIGDAMILATLLEALFGLGVTLVATSNSAPHNLYKNGLQRQRFLPAISMLETFTRVMALDGDVDHRLRHQRLHKNYFTPCSANSTARLRKIYRSLAPVPLKKGARLAAAADIIVNGRPLKARHICGDVAWFDFMDLCGGPRSQLDYIEISKRFRVLIVSDVPGLGGGIVKRKVAVGTEDGDNNCITGKDRSVKQGKLDDAARRFVALVDEFYDQHVHLLISAEVPIEDLYQGGCVSFAFQRTVSRLIEMQSQEYVDRCSAERAGPENCPLSRSAGDVS
jgi:cell division protein ZapE